MSDMPKGYSKKQKKPGAMEFAAYMLQGLAC